MMRHSAVFAVDVENAVGVMEGCMDHAVVHEFCEEGGMLFEASVLDGAGYFFY